MVYFQFSAISRQTFFDIFYISSHLFGKRAQYTLVLQIHCVYYLFKKKKTVGRGRKFSTCQLKTP